MNLINYDLLLDKDLDAIFSFARKIRNNEMHPTLKNKTCIAFFPDSSIRTKITFELAIRNLGGTTILFPSSTLDKNEDYKDVIGYIQNWAEICIIRYSKLDVIKRLADHSKIPIINAMTSENHPCEIISDLFSISERIGSYKGKEYTFIGMPGNILNTWIDAAKVFGFTINHVSTEENQIMKNTDYYRFSVDIEEFIAKTDVLLTDSLPEKYRNEQYYRNYQINREMISKAKRTILINPCPPFHRDEEIASDIIDSDYFVGYSFKEPLLSVQQAIIKYCVEN